MVEPRHVIELGNGGVPYTRHIDDITQNVTETDCQDGGVLGVGFIFLDGVGNVIDGETVTINGVTFEFDNDAAVVPGNVLVTMGAGVDWTTTATNLGAAINAHTTVDVDAMLNITGGTATIFICQKTNNPSALQFTGLFTNGWVSNTALGTLCDSSPIAQRKMYFLKHVVTAEDVIAYSVGALSGFLAGGIATRVSPTRAVVTYLDMSLAIPIQKLTPNTISLWVPMNGNFHALSVLSTGGAIDVAVNDIINVWVVE